jgi:hypothetical protein
MKSRFILTLAGLLLAITGVFAVVGAAPANAGVEQCQPMAQLTFHFVGTTSDGYTGVSRSQVFRFLPTTADCPRPYEGVNNDCGTFRLVVLESPARGGEANIVGGWFRSCYTPQAAASQWDGWVWRGDYVFFEGRAWQSGHDMTCCGYAYY